MATITVGLVDESVQNGNRSIERDLLDWFLEDTVGIPWVKNVKTVAVAEE